MILPWIVLLSLLFSFVIAQNAPPGTVLLDSYTGTTDDEKLTNALIDVQSKTYIPAILLSGRTYNFAQTQKAFSGLKIIGPPGGYFDSELDNSKYNSVRVNLNVGTGSNSWFVGTTTCYNIFISQIGFASQNGNSQFWHHPLSAGTIYASTFETLGFLGFKYVFGDSTDKAALTQVNFKGQWTVLGSISTQFYLGGSDCELWTSGYLNIGSSANYPGTGQYLLHFEDLGKTNVGPIYVTAAYGWSGLLVDGDNSYGVALTIDGARFEGMNDGNPSNGAVVVQNGGKIIWRNIWVAYGMAKPNANQHTPEDQAMIMHLSGEALWDGLTYDRADNVNESMPVLYGLNGKIRIFNVFVGERGGNWSTLPLVKNIGCFVSVDNTVIVK